MTVLIYQSYLVTVLFFRFDFLPGKHYDKVFTIQNVVGYLESSAEIQLLALTETA